MVFPPIRRRFSFRLGHMISLGIGVGFGIFSAVRRSAPTFGEIVPKLGNFIGFGDNHGEIGFLGGNLGKFLIYWEKSREFSCSASILISMFLIFPS